MQELQIKSRQPTQIMTLMLKMWNPKPLKQQDKALIVAKEEEGKARLRGKGKRGAKVVSEKEEESNKKMNHSRDSAKERPENKLNEMIWLGVW